MRNRSGLHASFVLLALSLVGLGLVVAQPRGMPSHDGRLYPTFATPATHHAAASYSNLPLSFEANQGQTDAQVKFLSRGRGYTLFLAATEAVLTLKQASESSVVRMKLVGANPHAEVSGLEKLPGKSNYFIGNDPDKWRTNVPQYAKVRYENVYPGIDLVYYGTNQRQLEYDFVIAPGADPGRIRLRLEGANDLALDEKGT